MCRMGKYCERVGVRIWYDCVFVCDPGVNWMWNSRVVRGLEC